MQSSSRSLSLDLLRAFAVLLVLFRHATPCPAGTSGFLFEVTAALQRGGWVGVDLFFVLSGFLIGGLLFQEHQQTGELQVGRFLARRGFKIYPLFWLALATVAFSRVAWGLPVPATEVIADLLFVSSYVPGLLGVGWSLSVEEQFYLFLPLLLLALAGRQDEARKPFRCVPYLAAGAGVVCLAWRALLFRPDHFSIFGQFNASYLRLDALLTGVCLAYFFHYHREPFVAFATRQRSRLLLYGTVGLLPAFFVPFISWYTLVPSLSVHALASAALIAAATVAQPSGTWAQRQLARVGRHSYAIYLFHFWLGTNALPLFFQATGWPVSWWTYAVLYFGGSLALGALLTVLVERPLLRLRDRWIPAAGRGAKVTATTPGRPAAPSREEHLSPAPALAMLAR